MNRLSFAILISIFSAFFNPVKAAIFFNFSPTPLIATADTVLTLSSSWPDRIQVFPGSIGFNANVILNGNIVNVDVSGGFSLVFFPGMLTNTVNLGNLSAGDYQLRLRFRNLPIGPDDPGSLNPGVVATANFTVGAGPVLATQVPALSPGAMAALGLLVMSFGVFAAQRRQ